MKKHFFSNHQFCFTALLLALTTFFACQSDDSILNPSASQEAIHYRTNPPEVPAILEVPAGNEVSKHVYADGVQVYRSTQTSPGVFAWVFKEPIATLYNNAGFSGEAGTHYAGPTWESNSGSKVVGVRLQGATVDPNAIPWLLLGAVTSSGPGIFLGTTYIQRVNTVGGKAPTSPVANAGNVGQEIQVPYTAEYYFYRAE
jgi:hypothetical protein